MPDHPSRTRKAGPASDGATMSFAEHLEELRSRMIWSLVGLAPIAAVTLVFGKTIIGFLARPVIEALRASDATAVLQVTGPVEAFGAYFRVALLSAAVVGGPWILYQAWRFVRPGLHVHERRFVYFLAPLSTVMAALGLVFMYLVMLPVALMFFIGFGATVVGDLPARAPVPEGVVLATVPALDADPVSPKPGEMWVNRANNTLSVAVEGKGGQTKVLAVYLTAPRGIVQQYRIAEYIKLVFGFALAFAIGFQTPVVVLLLAWTDVVPLESMRKRRKYVVFGASVVAAALTPPDPVSLFVLWLPLIALYEVGLLMARFVTPARVARGMRREPPSAGDE